MEDNFSLLKSKQRHHSVWNSLKKVLHKTSQTQSSVIFDQCAYFQTLLMWTTDTRQHVSLFKHCCCMPIDMQKHLADKWCAAISFVVKFLHPGVSHKDWVVYNPADNKAYFSNLAQHLNVNSWHNFIPDILQLFFFLSLACSFAIHWFIFSIVWMCAQRLLLLAIQGLLHAYCSTNKVRTRKMTEIPSRRDGDSKATKSVCYHSISFLSLKIFFQKRGIGTVYKNGKSP